MKKLFIISLIAFSCNLINAQVFGTAEVLSKNKGNFGILPTIYEYNGNSDMILFLQGGYGLSKGIDLGLKLGVLSEETYFGMDVEFAIRKNLSLSGGCHINDVLGLDFTGLYTFNLNNYAKLTSGLDIDIMTENDHTIAMWLPLNLEVDIKKNLVFIFEADIDTKLIDDSYNIISGGIQFYF